MPDSPAINPITGEPQSPSGWSQDDPASAAATAPRNGAAALAPQSPFAQGAVPKAYQDESAAYARKAEADKAAWEAREAAWTPIKDKLQRELLAGNPPPPDQQQLPSPPSVDPKRYQQNALAFVGAMAAFGALMGKFSRNAGNASLNAFAGAVNGWKQGNLQTYEQQSKEWEQKTKQMLANNKIVLDKYKAILENKNLNIEQQMMAAKLVAAEYQDKIGYDALEANNYTMFAQLYDKQTAAQDKAVNSYLKLSGDKFHETEQNQAKARQLETPEGQAWMQALDPANRMKLEGFLKVYGSGAPPLSSSTSDPATLDADAERYRQTGTLPPNMGRGIQGQQQATEIRRRATELEIDQGGNPTEWPRRWQEFKARGAGLSREQGAIGQRAGAIAIAVDEADRTIPIVRQLAERSAAKGLATWNAVENKWQVESGDRNFQEYVTQLNSLVNIYGRVISGGNKGTVSDLEHARELANPNMPLSGIEGSLDAMAREIKIAQTAPDRVREMIHQQQENAHQQKPPSSSSTPNNDGWGNLRVQP